MAGSNNKPAKQESQPPRKGAGSSAFRLAQKDEEGGFDEITRRVMLTKASMSMSGPLPPGVEYASYENTLPGSANRVMTMAEIEQQARLKENSERLILDGKLVKGHNWRAGFAQPAALILVLASFYVSYDLVMHNHDWAGATLGTSTIGAILAAFLKTQPSAPPEGKGKVDSSE